MGDADLRSMNNYELRDEYAMLRARDSRSAAQDARLKAIMGELDRRMNPRGTLVTRRESFVRPRGAGGTPYRENGAKMRATIDSWIKALSYFERHRRGNEAKLGHNTVIRTRSTGVAGSPDVEIVLHSTPIVTYHADGTVTLNSGGWQSVTTKARMNEVLPAHLGIYQKKNVWYVHEGGVMGPKLKFFDGMRLGTR